MKIVGITPSNPNTGETPEEMYLRKLRDLGHEVIIGESFQTIPKDTDVVVAMSEVSCENAFNMARGYNKPFYAHMEWLPYWRIFYEDEKDWGMKDKIPYEQKMNFIRLYQHYSFFWSMGDVKSLAADCFHESMKKFIGRDIDIHTKYLGVDSDKIQKFIKRNPDLKIKHEVTCVARFVPHKRLHHVIEALEKIGFSGTLNLVGYGPEENRYLSYKPSFKIKICDSKKKLKLMSRSKVTVALWSGMVPAESMYLGTPCITYDSPYMRELYGDNITYAKNNDIDDLAKELDMILAINPEASCVLCDDSIKNIEDGKCNTLTQDRAVRLLEGLIITAKNNATN